MDRYTDRTQLGVTKSGPVFRAVDSQSGQPVLIKLLPADGQAAHAIDGSAVLAMAPQLTALSGFNIAKCVEVSATEQGVEIVSEFIQGPNALQHPEKGKMRTSMAADILNQLLNAAADGERFRHFHGDWKPSNVLMGTMPDGRAHVKVTDWAMAQARQLPTPESLIFLAPERLDGAGPTARSELFSVGAIIYYLLTGFTLVTGRTAAEVKAAWSRADAGGHLKKIRKDLNSKLMKLVAWLLEVKPEKRPGSAAEAMKALAELNPPPLPQPAAAPRQPGSATQPMRPGHSTQPLRPGPAATQQIRPGPAATQPMRPGPSTTQPMRPTATPAAPIVPIVPLQPPAAAVPEAPAVVPVVAMRPPPEIAAQLHLPETPPVAPESAPIQAVPPSVYQQPIYQQPAYQQPGYLPVGYGPPPGPQHGHGMPPQMVGGQPGVRMTGMMMPRYPQKKSNLPLIIGLVSLITVSVGGFFLWKLWSDRQTQGGAKQEAPVTNSTDLQAKMRAAAERQKEEKEKEEKERQERLKKK